MDRRVTVNVPESPPDEHDGEGLIMSIDDRDNLVITVRKSHARGAQQYEVLAIYARGFWADVRIEDLET